MPVTIAGVEVSTDTLGIAFLALAAVLIVIMGAIVKSTLVGKALEPTKWIDLKLIEREEISPDTRRFRFALPGGPDQVLGLPCGQHISLAMTTPEGKEVMRSYTPVSSDDETGYVDFVIKVYFANVHPKFPAGGVYSQYLEGLKLGDKIKARGPKGKLEYVGNGRFRIEKKKSEGGGYIEKHVSHIGMIAGGTGITPMMQVARAIAKKAGDRAQMHLLFANQTENDILLRDEIEMWHKDPTVNFKRWYTLDRPGDDWEYSTGFINEEMLKENMPPPGDDTLILMCGPPPMIKFACLPNLEKLGYKESMLYTF